MSQNRKKILVAAAVAGLVAAGGVAKAKLMSDSHAQALAGKQAASYDRSLNACNGCGGKSTNSPTTNSLSTN